MNIEVHIERLILDGIDIPHQQQPHLHCAVEAELTHLLANGELNPGLMAGEARPTISGGDIQLAAEGEPTHLGQQIAQAMYGGIGR